MDRKVGRGASGHVSKFLHIANPKSLAQKCRNLRFFHAPLEECEKKDAPWQKRFWERLGEKIRGELGVTGKGRQPPFIRPAKEAVTSVGGGGGTGGPAQGHWAAAPMVLKSFETGREKTTNTTED